MALPRSTTPWLTAWRDQVRAWGWPGIIGGGFLLIAVAVALGWTPTARHEAGELQERARAAESLAARHAASDRDEAGTASPADRFVRAFAPLSTRQDRIAALLALASAHHLESVRSEFQQSREPTAGLIRFRVTMPLTGSYTGLRDFIDEAQERDTGLSLDRLRLRRPTAGTATLAADLVWSFYLRDESTSAGRPAGDAAAAVSR